MENFEFTGQQKKLENGVVVKRVRRKGKDHYLIKVGELGGWIEKEENLQGNAMVLDEAMVYGSAVAEDYAVVSDTAVVKGFAKVKDRAVVEGRSRVSGSAVLKDRAVVKSHAKVSGSAVVQDTAVVSGYAVVEGRSEVRGRAALRCGILSGGVLSE